MTKLEDLKRGATVKGIVPGTADEIQRLAPDFLKALGSVIGVPGERAIDIITRRGRVLTAAQVSGLLKWLNGSYRAP